MSYETVIYEKADKVAKISLNRPERMNAAISQMWSELVQAIGEAATDVDVRVVVITGVGRGFCSGDDHDMLRDKQSTRGFPQDEGRLIIPFISDLHRLEKPTIAMVNGVAVGGGFDLALACDMRVGS